jgi:hypothetical protein
MSTDRAEVLKDQDTQEKKFINPTSSNFNFPKELDKELFLSANIKGKKNVDLGIQLKDLYSSSFSDLVSKACKFSGISESDADSYLHFAIGTIPKDSIK